MAVRAASIGQRLDRLPITAFHRRLVLAVGLGLLVDGFDTYLAAGVAGALVKQGIAELQQIATLVAVTFLGLSVGGLTAGFLGDRLGRRRALQLTLGIVIVGSLGTASAPDMTALTLWRALTAIGLGGETVLGFAVISEFVPPAVRGRWMAMIGVLANLGMPLALFVGYAILPQPNGWRWMFAIPAVAAIGVIWLRRRLVESPRWLEARGRHAEAEQIVAAIEATVPPSHTVPPADGTASSPESPYRNSLRLLSRAPFRTRLVVGAAINVGVMSAVFGFIGWLPTFFATEGHDIADSVLFAAIMAIGSPFGVYLGMLITDRIERKWGVVIFSLVAAALGVAYAFASSAAVIVTLGFCVVTAVYLTGALGMTGYVPELFPTGLRMRGVGICVTVGRIVAITMPFVILPVYAAAGQGGVVGLISAILVAQAMIVARFGECTNGRSLEAVAANTSFAFEAEGDGAEVVRGTNAERVGFATIVARAREQSLYAGTLDVAALRQGFAAFAKSPLARPVPPGTQFETIDAGGVPACWVRAPALWRTAPVLFFHGGGYVCGSLEGTRGVAAALSTALAAPVLAVLYRQAPEQPFPAAVDDALASYRWLVQSQADAVLLAGESAGAALAVTAALRAAGTGLRPARGVIAVSGVFDLGFAGESWEINAEQDLITRATGEFLYGLYLAGHEPRDPLASPVHADFRRSPPLLIQAGGAEVLLDDSRRLVQKARTDGAHVSFQIYAGMPHNFTKFRGPLADAALAAMARWERGLHCRAQ